MLESYYQISFILIMAMSAIGIAGFLPLLFIQHLIYKKIFDPIYFNQNYYTAYELSIFNSFPLYLIKTIGYIKAIVFPGTMRRKFKNNILTPKDMPVIYALAWITILILIFAATVLINTGIVAIFIVINK